MTVTKSDLKSLQAEATCVVGSVESGVGYMYLGFDNGDVYKYNIPNATLTLLKNVGGRVISMALYSSTLYLGIAGGKFASLTTS